MEPQELENMEMELAIARMIDKMRDGSISTLTAVEHNVVLGLILEIKKTTGGYNLDFLTTMQDALVLVGFPTPQVMEIMTQYFDPESPRFQSDVMQHFLEQELDTHEYN